MNVGTKVKLANGVAPGWEGVVTPSKITINDEPRHILRIPGKGPNEWVTMIHVEYSSLRLVTGNYVPTKPRQGWFALTDLEPIE